MNLYARIEVNSDRSDLRPACPLEGRVYPWRKTCCFSLREAPTDLLSMRALALSHREFGPHAPLEECWKPVFLVALPGLHIRAAFTPIR